MPQQAVTQQGSLPQQGLPQQQQQQTPASAYQHQLQQAQGAMRLGMPLQAGVQQHPNGERVPRLYWGVCLPLGLLRSLFPEGFSPESYSVIRLPAADGCAQHVLDMLLMPQVTFAKPPVVASRHLCWRSAAAGKRPMTYTCRMQLL